MCCAAQPPQRPYQGQIGLARSGAALSVSTSSARLPASLTSARSPGSAPGTLLPFAATPWPCASSATIESSSTGSAMAGGDQEFPRSAAAEDRRRNEAERRPALRFDRGAHSGARACERRFASDPALDDVGPSELELRLDEADEPRRLGSEFQHMRQHEPLRNEAHVDDDRRRPLAETLGVKRARIDAFERAARACPPRGAGRAVRGRRRPQQPSPRRAGARRR